MICLLEFMWPGVVQQWVCAEWSTFVEAGHYRWLHNGQICLVFYVAILSSAAAWDDYL